MNVKTKIDRSFLFSDACKALSRALRIPAIPTALLYSRGCRDVEQCLSFLKPSEALLHSPFLLPDIDAACARLTRAIAEREKILIYGDYDADGVTASSLTYLYLREKKVDVLVHIPDRFTEGYGMNPDVILRHIDEGVKLVLTVDNGSKAHEAIDAARSRGVDVIVTDHHECPETLPQCEALVNPMRKDSVYPFKGLCGVGVAFKLICALEERLCGGDPGRELLSRFADLIAIGTVADVMPLTDENRLIVSKGLEMIASGARPGIRALCAAMNAGKEERVFTAGTIGFKIAPRINAAGRMTNGTRAFLLLTTNDDDEARELSDELCRLNEQRQATENVILEEAVKMMADHKDDPFILLSKQGWHRGVIGIAAARIDELYNKPAILLSEENGLAKGSGRSVEGVNLVKLLDRCAPLIERYGGHEQAAGLTVRTEMIDALRSKLIELCPRGLPAGREKEADMELLPSDLTEEAVGALSLLEPFGTGNEEPCFLFRSFRLISAYPLSGGKHTKLTLEKDGIRVEALCFGRPFPDFPFSDLETLDLVGTLGVNVFNGRTRIQIRAEEISLDDASSRKRKDVYASFRRALDRLTAVSRADVPTRDDMARAYRFLRGEQNKGGCSLSYVLRCVPCFGLMKWFIFVEALKEKGLITQEYRDPEFLYFDFSLPAFMEKTDILDAPVLRNIIVEDPSGL